jgi:hypothetical protein
MKKIFSLVSAVIVLSQTLPGLAVTQTPGASKDDYAELRDGDGTPSVPGDIVECTGVSQYNTITGKQHQWMVDQGLIVRSMQQGPEFFSLEFSEKVTSRDSRNSPKFILGCWVLEGRTIKEVHQGRTFRFYQARFIVNSMVKGSPFMNTGFCVDIEDPKKEIITAADHQFTRPRCLAKRINGKDLVIPILMSHLEGKTKRVLVQ